jgi:hypothetical protein
MQICKQMETIQLIAEKEYTLKISGADLHYVMELMEEGTHRKVRHIFNSITEQVKVQLKENNDNG